MGWFLAANQCSSARHCYILQGSEKIQVSKMGLWVSQHTAPAFHEAEGTLIQPFICINARIILAKLPLFISYPF